MFNSTPFHIQAAEEILALTENTYSPHIRIISDSIDHKNIASALNVPLIESESGSHSVHVNETTVTLSNSIIGSVDHPAAKQIPTWRVERGDQEVPLREWYVSQNIRASFMAASLLAASVFFMYHGYYTETAMSGNPTFVNGLSALAFFASLALTGAVAMIVMSRRNRYKEVTNIIYIREENSPRIHRPIYKMQVVNREPVSDPNFTDPADLLDDDAA